MNTTALHGLLDYLYGTLSPQNMRWVADHLIEQADKVEPVEHKRYTMNQLCRIVNINMLKSALPLEQICGLLEFINGNLDDDSDDLIDDAKLYFLFVRLAARARYIGGTQSWDDALAEVTADYREPVPGAREKLVKVLRAMLTAWVAAQLRTQAEKMISELK